MSLNISIPKSDLAKGKLIADGWKIFIVSAVSARKGKKDPDSVTYVIEHKLENDPDERVIEHYFSSKALGMMNTWIAALAHKTVQEVLDSITTGTLNFDLEQQVGKKLYGKVVQDLYEGRVVNKLADFAPDDKVPF